MQTIPEGKNVTETQELSAKVNELTASVANWNTVIIIMMIVAALAAAGLVIVQHIAFKKAELLADTQELLNLAKDKQLAGELKDKDLRIAEAKAVAAKSNEQAAQAEQTAAEAKLALEKYRAPRRITAEQWSAFLKFVANTPKGKVIFRKVGNNKEVDDYTAALMSLFVTAGFVVDPSAHVIITSGARATGVTVLIKKQSTTPAHAGDIQNGLGSIGIKALGQLIEGEGEAIDEDAVMVSVGAKY